MLYINGVSIFLQDLHPEMILSPISSKITVTKEEERRKRNNEEKERRRREKSGGCTLSFHNGYFGDSLWTQKVHLAVTFSKSG